MLSKAKSDLSQSPKLSVGREQCDGGPRGYKVKAPRSMVCFWNQGECSFPTANSGILGVVWGWGGIHKIVHCCSLWSQNSTDWKPPRESEGKGHLQSVQ